MPKNKAVELTKSKLDELERTPSGANKKFLWDSKVPGLGVYKTSAGYCTFVYQYRMRGYTKTHRRKLGRLGQLTIATARDLAADLAHTVRRGINPIDKDREEIKKRKGDEKLILRNFVPEFYLSKESNGKTIHRNVRSCLENDIMPRLGGSRMDEITVGEINTMLADLRKRSDSAARRAIENLKAVLNYARKCNLIRHAATDAVPTPKSNKRERFFSRSETCRYLEAIHDLGGSRGPVLLVLFLLMRRVDEVADMTWEEIDRETWIWTLPGSREKTGQTQRIVLPRQVVAVLEAQQQDVADRHGPIFLLKGGSADDRHPNANGRDADWMKTKAWDHLDALIDRRLELHAAHNGSPRPHFGHYTIHDGRSTAATFLQQKPLSFPPHIIEAALNHASQDGGIKGVYQLHRYMDEVGDMLQRWADFVDDILSAPDAFPGAATSPS